MLNFIKNNYIKIIVSILIIIVAGALIYFVCNNYSKINDALIQTSKLTEQEVKNKLNNLLAEAKEKKEQDEGYNSEEYLTLFFEQSDFTVNQNVLTFAGYSFEIDRESLEILAELGQANVIITAEDLGKIGKNSERKKLWKSKNKVCRYNSNKTYCVRKYRWNYFYRKSRSKYV